MTDSTTAAIAGARDVPGVTAPGLGGLEPLYEPAEVAQYLRLDATTVRRIFLDREGVIKLGRPSAHHRKRSYCTLRIPESVLRRFLEERRK